MNLTASYNRATANIQAFPTVPLGNGWARNSPQGLYGTNYTVRAWSAINVYLQLFQEQSVYPMYAPKGKGTGAREVIQLSDFQDPIQTFAANLPLMNLSHNQVRTKFCYNDGQACAQKLCDNFLSSLQYDK